MKQMCTFMLFLAVIAMLVGCSQSNSDVEEETKIPVTVAPIERGDVEQSLTYQGDIQAEVAVKVFSKIPDRIEQFYVDDGDVVTEGQPVAKIFATTIEQGVRQAEAGLNALRAQEANLRVEYERGQRLHKEGAMSTQQFDTIEMQYKAIQAQVTQAEAALRSAQSSYQDATVTAPIDGIIGKRYLEVGDMASPGMPLVEIVQKERVKIIFDVTETDLGKIRLGQTAKVTVKSFPEEIFEGTVTEISPILDPMTRMATVEVIVDNAEDKLKPGMFANVTVITDVLENVISVPRFATLENTSLRRVDGRDEVVKKYLVYVVENGKALQRELEVNYINHMNIAVDAGVAVGDSLVIEGQYNLRDSVAVLIIKKENKI
ncbi:efflux RND transporter periplasmic adaptor subunit [candidate division KSB1 bacterium]|nr:efflux RND transporter periplasmic adaptor subunit [candidate division KSB1 bacterium]RQV99932.1 MAG: efflux RND transporter periplasmic adaptor subunit [candidate division KSB1 bacterium]